MFPPPPSPAQGLSSPGPPTVPPGPPENHPVNLPTSSSPNPPPEHPSGTPGRPPTTLLKNRFQLPAEPQKTDVAGIPEFYILLEISNDDYEADDDNEDVSDLGGAEGNLPISPKETEFSLTQSDKGWGRPTTVRSTSGRK